MKYLKKPVALAIGAAIAGSMAVTSVAQAAAYTATDLGSGYASTLAEGSCGGDKGKEGKCGEGKCGAHDKGEEGKCGEGKCGAHDKGKEGKCGEGKCGGEKQPEGEKPGN
jgi:uncharacterized low-complexity protein